MNLFFDTETTGKCDFRCSAEYDGHPRIVQFAALLCDEKGKEMAMFSAIVKPSGWTVPDEAAAIHGVTTDIAERAGVPVACVLSMFGMMAAQADTVIAHNIDFDDLVTRSEYCRAEKQPRFASLAKFCTMKATTNLCKLPGNYGKYKRPKLEEAYRILLGKELMGAHDALADVRACAELFFHLNK